MRRPSFLRVVARTTNRARNIMAKINIDNWLHIRCGTVLAGKDGKLWKVVYRDVHNLIVDVAPNGATNGKEARLTIRDDQVVVQTNWEEAVHSLAGCRTSIFAA